MLKQSSGRRKCVRDFDMQTIDMTYGGGDGFGSWRVIGCSVHLSSPWHSWLCPCPPKPEHLSVKRADTGLDRKSTRKAIVSRSVRQIRRGIRQHSVACDAMLVKFLGIIQKTSAFRNVWRERPPGRLKILSTGQLQQNSSRKLLARVDVVRFELGRRHLPDGFAVSFSRNGDVWLVSV